jgi:SHAQKYF class myb-like DNA-binding protein
MPCDSPGEEGDEAGEQNDSERTDNIEKEKAGMAVAMMAALTAQHKEDPAKMSAELPSSDRNPSFAVAASCNNLPHDYNKNRRNQQQHCSSRASRPLTSRSHNLNGLENCPRRGSVDQQDRRSSFETGTISKILSTTAATTALTTHQHSQEQCEGVVDDTVPQERETHQLEHHITDDTTPSNATSKKIGVSDTSSKEANGGFSSAVPSTEIAATITATSVTSSLHLRKAKATSNQQRQQLHIEDIAMCLADMGPCITSEPTERSTEDTSSNADKQPTEKLQQHNNKGKRKRSDSGSYNAGQSAGRWTQEEHQAFLEGLKECGREWKKVAMRIPTRTSAQIRSHAQKYFAKLQRDHESNRQFLTSGGIPSTGHSEDSPVSMVTGEGGLLTGVTIATHSSSSEHLAPSLQRSVERIIANPHAAQREVEYTLEALRERYRQLQLRLERRIQRRGVDGDTNSQDGDGGQYPGNHPPPSGAALMQNAHYASRKRVLQETSNNLRGVSATQETDENSSVSSNVSSMAASRGNLENDEILALQVLGGDLPRGDSSVEDNGPAHIPTAVDVEEASAIHSTLGNDSTDLGHLTEQESASALQEAKNRDTKNGSSASNGAHIDSDIQQPPQNE